MNEHPLHSIFHPRSIVIAGAGRKLTGMGRIQALNVLRNGFAGEVVFLHPTERELLGRPAYTHPRDLPFVPDLALLITPVAVTPDVLDALGERGVRRAIVTTGGFSELGAEGRSHEARLLEVAARHGIRFVGPNCIGVLNTHHGLNTTILPTLVPPGPLSLLSQSGTFLAQTPLLLRDLGIRLGKAVSVGNSANLDLVDCLEYVARDPETRAICVYIEGIRRGRAFVELAREVTREKPVVALYSGGTRAGARAGLSHTASLGGPDRLYDGALEQAGVLRAKSVMQLFQWGWTLATQPIPRGTRFAVLTNSGGPASCMADELEREGLELPPFDAAVQARLRPHVTATASLANPIDLTFSVDTAALSEKLPEILFGLDEIDGVLVHGIADTGYVRELLALAPDLLPAPPEAILQALRFDLRRLFELPRQTGKPLVASTFVWDDHAAEQFRKNDVPLFNCPSAAVRAMAKLVCAARVRRRPPFVPADGPAPGRLPVLDAIPAGAGRVVLDEHASKTLLRAWGALVPDERVVDDLAAARAALRELGGRVVLKGLPAGVAHKSDVGLVHLDLRDECALTAAWEAIEAVAPGCPRLVAPLLRGERELAVGMTRFPGFGPCVMLGAGGRFAEATRDVTFRLAPVSRHEAETMLDSLRYAPVCRAVRGLPALDRGALARTIVAVSRLAVAHPEVAEVDVNPLIVVGAEPVVADALVVVAR
jgi:acetyltransferase